MDNNINRDLITPTVEEVKKQQLIEVLVGMIKKYAETKIQK